MKDERILDLQWIKDNTDMYLGTIQVYAEDLIRILEEARDSHAKLEYIAKEMKTEDGMFTFPDGDYVKTQKL